MSRNYILVDGQPVASPYLLTWAMTMSDDMRRVALTYVVGVRVSTVFLGLDHGFDDGPPVLFETMIFGEVGDLDQYQERYTTLEAAMAGHERAVEMVRAVHPWLIYARRFVNNVVRVVRRLFAPAAAGGVT
jgi:hypothetical protein